MRAYAFVLLTACGAPHAPEENEVPPVAAPLENETRPEDHFAPAWRTGDTWTVRLRTLDPGMRGPRYPPEIQENDWIYRVVETTPEAVHISAQEDIGPRPQGIWHFIFAPNGRVLSVDNNLGDRPFVAVADAPILEPRQRLTRQCDDAWPRFPLEEDFGPDDAELRQRSRPFGNELEVAIIRAGHDRGLERDFVRTATQRWEAGRPWWSILRIDEEYTNRHGTTTRLAMEGEVIAWPTGTPE